MLGLLGVTVRGLAAGRVRTLTLGGHLLMRGFGHRRLFAGRGRLRMGHLALGLFLTLCMHGLGGLLTLGRRRLRCFTFGGCGRHFTLGGCRLLHGILLLQVLLQ